MKRKYVKYIIIVIIAIIAFVNTDYFKYRELRVKLSDIPNKEIIKNMRLDKVPPAACSHIDVEVKKDATPEQIRDCFFAICKNIEKYKNYSNEELKHKDFFLPHMTVKIYTEEFKIKTNHEDYFILTNYITYTLYGDEWIEDYWNEKIPR